MSDPLLDIGPTEDTPDLTREGGMVVDFEHYDEPMITICVDRLWEKHALHSSVLVDQSAPNPDVSFSRQP